MSHSQILTDRTVIYFTAPTKVWVQQHSARRNPAFQDIIEWYHVVQSKYIHVVKIMQCQVESYNSFSLLAPFLLSSNILVARPFSGL